MMIKKTENEDTRYSSSQQGKSVLTRKIQWNFSPTGRRIVKYWNTYT